MNTLKFKKKAFDGLEALVGLERLKCLGVNVGLEIPNFVGIILPTPLKSFVNSLSNIRKPQFYRFMFIHP